MVSRATEADFTRYTGLAVPTERAPRLLELLDDSERLIRRRLKVDFYDDLAPDSDASRDWVELVTLVTEPAYLDDGLSERERRQRIGPYRSETFGGDYSYTKGDTLDPFSLPRVVAIIGANVASAAFASATVMLAGPTRYKAENGILEGEETGADPDYSRNLRGW